jgi:hypothetical protein
MPVRPVAPLSSMARIERISEPWALNRTFAIIITFALAMLLGTWAASGEVEYIIIVAVWFGAVMVILFVRDYWWSPALVITAFSMSTTALGFPMSGMEIAVVIIGLTFPIKIAMKTLRKAEPEMECGPLFWTVLGYMAVHAVVIYFYNKIEGTPVLKNIIKAYYGALAPLVLYGLLIRYCHTRTVRPTVIVLFFTTLFVVTVSMFTQLSGISVDAFTGLHITLGWLDANGAMAILRISGPYLFIGSVAFWPAMRGGFPKFLVTLGVLIGAVGTMVGGGRLSLAICIAAGAFFAILRGKLWIAAPFILITGLIAAVIATNPDVLFDLPVNVQRALTPLNFSREETQVQETLGTSDDWHRDLRIRSFYYWTEDTTSFWLGHGYKSWDQTVSFIDPTAVFDQERVEQLAVEMGLTENMFSSTTNVLGATGLFLYLCFLCHIGWLLIKGIRRSPARSEARAMCEFSLVNLAAAVLFCPFMGGVPALNLIFWQLGILAARPYLAIPKTPRELTEAAPLPKFIPKSLGMPS